MRAFGRHVALLLRDLGWYGLSTGHWWLVVVVAVLTFAALLGPAVKVVVAPTLYVLF